jgi:hypothetical protein
VRRILIPIATLLVAITSAGFIAADRVLADEMQVFSSDVNACFLPLELDKSVAIDLPRDIEKVWVSNPLIADAVVKTKRRAFIVGKGEGQTNIFFYAGYDDKPEQIGALNITVVRYPVPPPRPTWCSPSEMVRTAVPVVVFRGIQQKSLTCTDTQCFAREFKSAGPATGENSQPNDQNTQP